MEEKESLETKLPSMSTPSKKDPWTMDVSSPMSLMDVLSPRRTILKSSAESIHSASGLHAFEKTMTLWWLNWSFIKRSFMIY